MKLNLGCGVNKIEGFVNVDKYPTGEPDIIMDIEVTPWEFEDNSFDEININHTLEHVGAKTEVFLSIIKELYRVSKPGAKIQINVPHPRHDNFINDPTHVRIITPELMALFNKKNCLAWKEMGAANSPLALYLDVDFEMENFKINLESNYLNDLQSGKITQQDVVDYLKRYNNVATEFQMTFRVNK